MNQDPTTRSTEVLAKPHDWGKQLIDFISPKGDPFNIVWPHNQTLPEIRREIRFDEWLWWKISEPWSTDYIYYHQISMPEDPRSLWTVHAEYSLRMCLAYATKYVGSGSLNAPSAPFGLGLTVKAPSSRFPQAHMVRWFRLGCEHPHIKEYTARMFDHQYTCGECGLVYSVDSSG